MVRSSLYAYGNNAHRRPSNTYTDSTLPSNLSYFSMVCLKRIVITKKKLFTDGYFPTQAKCYISSFGVYYSLEFTHFKLIIYFKNKKIGVTAQSTLLEHISDRFVDYLLNN